MYNGLAIVNKKRGNINYTLSVAIYHALFIMNPIINAPIEKM